MSGKSGIRVGQTMEGNETDWGGRCKRGLSELAGHPQQIDQTGQPTPSDRPTDGQRASEGPTGSASRGSGKTRLEWIHWSRERKWTREK